MSEANKAIEDLTQEKHDIMAKFKHLMQVHLQNISNSELMSSYKGDDSSLSLNDCFEKLEVALEEGQND